MRAARVALALFLVALAAWLQGCVEEPECPGEYEAMVLWVPDWTKLDELAGCRSGWSPFAGQHCASDVPVPFAKKGLYAEDEAWIQEGATNSRGACLTRSPQGACISWWENKMGCERDVFEVCNCTEQALSGRYCPRWRCIAHQISHYQCWEAEWDEAYASECGVPGDDPLILNISDIPDLLAAQGSANLLQQEYDVALRYMRSKRKNKYTFRNLWVTTKRVEKKLDEPGATWRYIFAKHYTCECTQSWQGEHFCAQWHCDGDGALYHPERLESSCIADFQVNTSDPLAYPDVTHRCGAWEGSRLLWETAELVQCRAFTHPNISEWACTSFHQPRIEEFKNDSNNSIFHERFFFALLHLLWITPIAEVGIFISLAPAMSRRITMDDVYPGPAACFIFCSYVCVNLASVLIWLIAFVRDAKDKEPLARNEQVAPGAAFGGCLFLVSLAWLIALQTLVVRKLSGFSEEAAAIPMFITSVSVIIGVCMTYACGLIVGAFILIPLLCCLGYWTYSGVSERLYGQL